MKNKNIIKIIICLMLSCSLCVSAPLARYQKIESHAAIAVPIAIGAGTIALMYLAACGVSYIFQDMSQAEAEHWIDTKIIEFSAISNGNGGTYGPMPNGPSNWKMTALGALLIGSNLANWLSPFKNWLIGSQEDNTTQVVYHHESIVLSNGLVVPRLSISSSEVSNYSLYSGSLTVYDYDDLMEYINDFGSFVIQPETFVGAIPGLTFRSSVVGSNVNCVQIGYSGNNVGGSKYLTGSDLYNPGAAFKLFSPFITSDEQIAYYAITWHDAVKTWTTSGYSNLFPLKDCEELNKRVTQKAETVYSPQVIENNYYYTLNPDVLTTTQDLNGVPVPLSAADIADAVWEKISLNTSANTVYQPELLPAVDGFSEQANINTDDYDEPLPDPEPEPEPEPEPQLDWDSMTAGDVPAFATSIWNYFLQNHNWQQLKQKFPFSLPYDAYLIANIFFDTSYDVMDELPTDPGSNRRLVKASNAPVYSFSIPKWDGTTYELVLDFSLIDPWQPIIRAAVGVLFTVGLIVGVL